MFSGRAQDKQQPKQSDSLRDNLRSEIMRVAGLLVLLVGAVHSFTISHPLWSSSTRSSALSMAARECPEVPLTPRPGLEIAVVACG